MAKPIEQVEQDLHQLRTSSREIGRELTAAYRSYFGCFAPTLKQQSIQGCYHLCTNFYPEAFLKINYDRRAQLLKMLQRVISNAIADLSVHIESPSQTSTSNDDDEPTGELTALPAIPIDWFETPSSLSTWQRNLEEELNHSLKEISYKLNVLLQQAQIMPPNIPKPILEANPEADRQGGSTANIPNLLSVLIGQNGDRQEEEHDGEDDDNDEEDALDAAMENLIQRRDPATIIQIHSLYLRLTEIEFSNVNVLTLRKNISQLTNKVKILNREYTHKQQELKVAEAEAAWRNSWFEN